MQKRILVTGVSGVGKTTICKRLKSLGYEAVDIENIEGMFEMFHKGTKQVFNDYNNANPKHIKNAEWVIDMRKLKTLLGSQKSKIMFYCGIASNIDEIISLFDKVIVLQLSSKVLNERLKNREGTNDIGNTQEGRNVVLGWKDGWEGKMKKKSAILIDANKSPEETSKEILKNI